MKTAKDPRHLHRIGLLQSLFGYSLSKIEPSPKSKLYPIIANLPDIDSLIGQKAPKWPLDQINKVDLAILRLAIWEINYVKTPPKVVVDESVELAKEFGNESSSEFVNGVLGSIIKHD